MVIHIEIVRYIRGAIEIKIYGGRNIEIREETEINIHREKTEI